MYKSRISALVACIGAASLLMGAAKGAPKAVTVFKQTISGLAIEVSVGAPDRTLGPIDGKPRALLMQPDMPPSNAKFGPGTGRGPGAFGPKAPKAKAFGGPGGGGTGPGGGAMGPGPGKRPWGPGGDGPPEGGPGGGMGDPSGGFGGPEALMDMAKPTHGFTVSIKDRRGKKMLDLGPTRLVAVRKDVKDVAVAILPPAGDVYGANIPLPGKGAYKVFLRVLDPKRKPVTATFDYTY